MSCQIIILIEQKIKLCSSPKQALISQVAERLGNRAGNQKKPVQFPAVQNYVASFGKRFTQLASGGNVAVLTVSRFG